MSESAFYRDLPKKRMAVGVVFLNHNNQLLVVKPTYKDHWSIPGGVVNQNESPRDACVREVREELGLDIATQRLLCVDYTSPDGEKSESLQFIFYGGVLTSDQLTSIRLAPQELAEYRFLGIEQALPLLSKTLGRRVQKGLDALKNNTVRYLEHGQEKA